MNETAVAKLLGILPKDFRKHLKDSDIQQLSIGKINYLRLRNKISKSEEGTVIFLDPLKIIHSYKKIRRAIVLEAALKKHFQDFFIEEKLDGYNIRITKTKDKILAISRGGLVCPYSTHFINQKPEIAKFLEDNDLVLCCELIGKESPYVTHEYPEAHNLNYFIFDIHKNSKSIPVQKRQELCKQYGLNQVKNLGYFQEPGMNKIWSLLKNLESRNREGIVIKSPDMKKQMKYTVSNANLDDIEFAFHFPFDSGMEFFFRRFIREAFQSFELNESDAEMRKRAEQLGLSIIKPLRESIERVSKGEKLIYDSEIEGDMETLKNFVKYLKNLGVKFDYELKGNKLKIKRLHQSSHDKIQNYLAGDFASD